MWPTKPQIVIVLREVRLFVYLFIYFKCLMAMKESCRALGHVKWVEGGQWWVCESGRCEEEEEQ